MAELEYRYRQPSTVCEIAGTRALALATAGGKAPNPHFFSGFVENPKLIAQALLSVAEVARTRYFDPGAAARSRDPVVTANESVLRFESFSGCNGVYSRLDVDDSALDGTFADWGTTNVDVNQPMRTALAGIGPGEPLRMAVGADELVVDTIDESVVEKKVPLPERWVRGFAEVSVVATSMVLVQELPSGAARKLLRDLPRLKERGASWIRFGAGGFRATRAPGPDDVCLAGPFRLRSLQRLIPHVTGLRIYAPPPAMRLGVGGRPGTERAAQASAWEVLFDGARQVLVVSPEIYRGFSGEGAVLDALAAVDGSVVERAARELHGQSVVDPASVATALEIDRNEALNAVQALGAAGRVGFDLSGGTHFHRDLPFDRSVLDEMQPRLVGARELVAAGAVAPEGDNWAVSSGTATYLVRLGGEMARCTCPWFAKHRGERGPCKHVLAAQLAGARESV